MGSEKRLDLLMDLVPNAAKRGKALVFAAFDGRGILEAPVNSFRARRKYWAVIARVIADCHNVIERLPIEFIDGLRTMA